MPDVVLIYGPPAAGKLTVGNALAVLTGYAVVDNHLTRNIARKLPLSRDAHEAMVERLRMIVVEEAVGDGIGLILTTAFLPDARTIAFYASIDDRVRRLGARMHRVQLLPSVETLERRMVESDRGAHGKLQNPAELEPAWAHWYEKLQPDDLSIDNTALPPDEVARLIVERFGLQTVVASRAPDEAR